MTTVGLTVNGRAVNKPVDPRTHLADFLRQMRHQHRNGFGIPGDDNLHNSMFVDNPHQALVHFLGMLRLRVLHAPLITCQRPSAHLHAVHRLISRLIVVKLRVPGRIRRSALRFCLRDLRLDFRGFPLRLADKIISWDLYGWSLSCK